VTWATPRTWVTGEVVRARYFNQDVSASLAACVSVESSIPVGFSGTTTSTTYADPSDYPGPAVTVTHGFHVVSFHHVQARNNTAGNYAIAAVALSGDNAFAANDHMNAGATAVVANALNAQTTMVDWGANGSYAIANGTGLGVNPGTTTFTMKYRVNGGTGTFGNRRILVIPS